MHGGIDFSKVTIVNVGIICDFMIIVSTLCIAFYGITPGLKRIGLISFIVSLVVNCLTYIFLSFETHCLISCILLAGFIGWALLGWFWLSDRRADKYIAKISEMDRKFGKIFGSVIKSARSSAKQIKVNSKNSFSKDAKNSNFKLKRDKRKDTKTE